MQIKIDTWSHAPSDEDWKRLFKYMHDQFIDTAGAALEVLLVRYLPETDRPEEMAEYSLDKDPIWVTTDESGFSLWLYADGSDSEG